jgi:hypothetical protein
MAGREAAFAIVAKLIEIIMAQHMAAHPPRFPIEYHLICPLTIVK